MYLGILGVSALAFSCSTEFIPELNVQMKIVKFTSDFKVRMTATMLIDYFGCYAIEKSLKWGFSDYRPKDIAIRRPEQIAKEEARKLVEAVEARKKKIEDDERKEKETIEKAEKAVAALRARWSRQ
jgi:cation-transporting ATPase 13A1